MTQFATLVKAHAWRTPRRELTSASAKEGLLDSTALVLVATATAVVMVNAWMPNASAKPVGPGLTATPKFVQ